MSETTNISAADFRRAANIKERIEGLERELLAIMSGTAKRGRRSGRSQTEDGHAPSKKKRRKKSKMSAEGRARIAAAQRKRWAAAKKKKK